MKKINFKLSTFLSLLQPVDDGESKLEKLLPKPVNHEFVTETAFDDNEITSVVNVTKLDRAKRVPI